MVIKLIRSLTKHLRGATAIEYGLIAALVAMTMVVGFKNLANTTIGMWTNVSTKVETAS